MLQLPQAGPDEPMPAPALGEPENEMPDQLGDMPTEEPAPAPEPEASGEDKEFEDIMSKLNTKQKATVLDYAKSMVEDEPEEQAPEMPPMTESIDRMISEIVNNVLSQDETDEEEDRRDDKIRNKKITPDNPFVAKNFK